MRRFEEARFTVQRQKQTLRGGSEVLGMARCGAATEVTNSPLPSANRHVIRTYRSVKIGWPSASMDTWRGAARASNVRDYRRLSAVEFAT